VAVTHLAVRAPLSDRDHGVDLLGGVAIAGPLAGIADACNVVTKKTPAAAVAATIAMESMFAIFMASLPWLFVLSSHRALSTPSLRGEHSTAADRSKLSLRRRSTVVNNPCAMTANGQSRRAGASAHLPANLPGSRWASEG
jgi:hypothetical protein